MKEKSIKDAIHGYIKLSEPFWKIIDTAEFQRLKWIEQTSYRVLYPSARHDRFIHSIGVYHLGQKAINGLLNNSREQDKEIVNKNKDSFLFACLLHDIGHAPFSHTCENLFNYKKRVSEFDAPINKELLTALESTIKEDEFEAFIKDYKDILEAGKSPAPHEVMSAIVSCRKSEEYLSFFDEDNKTTISMDLVVRSILGCTYGCTREDDEEVRHERGIKNCLIRLLNSSTVDVDKLDYLARDTRMSGYDNIVLDTERLLNSVCSVCDGDIYYPAFKKSALSVIRNVFLAKQLQAKWIINHPIVVYESYILQRAIGDSIKNYNLYDLNAKKIVDEELINFLFSSKSLSKEGNEHKDGSVTLLSDIEILSVMKQNIKKSSSILEFFSRNERKHPIWKSYEEFLYCLGSFEKAKKVVEFLAPLVNYFNRLQDLFNSHIIDESFYERIGFLEGDKEIKKILDILRGYKEGNKACPFEYVILEASNSFAPKIDPKKIFIAFDDDPLGHVTYATLYDSQQRESGATSFLNDSHLTSFSYMYSKEKINAKQFLNYLYDEIYKRERVQVL